MVALSAQPELPALTDRESELLASFVILRYDMADFAERNKLHPLELLSFARSPAIQAHLAELRAFADQAFALRSLESRTKAIDLLETLAKTSDSPIEKRRAASAILRGLAPLPSPRAARPVSSRPRISPVDEPPPPAPPPRPAVKPSPNFSHRDAADAISAALQSPSPESLATLHAFCAPGATLGQAPAPADQADFIQVAKALCPARKHAAVKLYPRPSTETAAHYLCSLRPDAHTSSNETDFDLRFIRNDSNCWLLSSLNRRIDPRGSG